MIKQLKYELLNRKRNLLLGCAGALLLYAVIYLLFGLLKVGGGGEGTKAAEIALTSIVFTAACILFILNPIHSIKRDFFDDSRYLTFLVPCRADVYLLSRIISICIDIVLFLVTCLLPFLLILFYYTGVFSDLMSPGRPLLNFPKELYFYLLFFTGILLLIQFILSIYLSVAVSKSLNLKKIGGLFVGLVTYVLSYYVFSFVELIVMKLFGSTIHVFSNLFFMINISTGDTKSLVVYTLIKLAEVAALFWITAKLIKEKINL